MNKSVSIDALIAEIIPPNDYTHRNGFSNKHIIDILSDKERIVIEEALIEYLRKSDDILIVETLGYMRSYKALPILVNLLQKTSNAMRKIIIATSVFEIDHNDKMALVCADAFSCLGDTFQKISAFYFLRKFENPITDSIIKENTEHPDYLISYNAKQALKGD